MNKEKFKEEIQYNKQEKAERIIKQVADKFGYDKELTDLLLSIYTRVYMQSSYEIQQIFFKTIQEVPIAIIDEPEQNAIEQILDKYLGKDRIKEEEKENQYNSKLGDGAYCTVPVLDEDGKLVGKKSVIYVSRIKSFYSEIIEKLGTNINVPHLLHEIGHAQVAIKDGYIQEGNKIYSRVGMIKRSYTIIEQDERRVLREDDSQGIYLEEALNTKMEYENVAKFMGITEQEVQAVLYNGSKSLTPSTYHGLMDSIAQKLQEVVGRKEIEQARFFDNQYGIATFNDMARKTPYWKEEANSEDEMEKKRKIFNDAKSEKWAQFCEENEDTYFTVKPEQTPLQKIDNVLQQIYDMCNIKYNLSIEEYKQIMNIILGEAYYILNQTERTKTKQQERSQE